MPICRNCGREHDGSFGSGLFCNKSCSCSYRNIPRMIWKCKICGMDFTSRRKLQKHRKDEHNFLSSRYNKGNHAWNHGLNINNSDIIKNMSNKIKEMYKCGKIINPLKNKKIDSKIKQKISQTMSKINSIKEFNCGRPDVKWFYIENIDNIKYCVRGTWEYNVARILNEHNIRWIRNRYIKYILCDTTKTYNPDFYIPDMDFYIEVKGWFKDEDIIKMNCVQIQNPDMKIYFIDSKYYSKFIKNEIFLIKDMLYTNHKKFKDYVDGSIPSTSTMNKL